MIRYLFLVFLSVASICSSVHADVLVFVIDESGTGYENSPSNYDNSPSNYDNSPSNYDNSTSNYDNSPSNYDNSPSNYDNGRLGERRIYTQDNRWLGYYTIPKAGMVNFYSTSGNRVFYHPANKNTRGVFFAEEGKWAGIIGKKNGRFAIGITQQAYYHLMSKQ